MRDSRGSEHTEGREPSTGRCSPSYRDRTTPAKKEFFRTNLDIFVADPKEPLKADEWLEQMVKTFDMLDIEDDALR